MKPEPTSGVAGRIALVCSEPVRASMAGTAIRYVEIARHLAAAGHPVTLISPAAEQEDAAPELPTNVRRVPFKRGAIDEATAGCIAAVGQGQLVNDLVIERPDLPVAVDLYDPWLVENLHYVDTLGYDPYRNDHASWMLQLSRGDLFLCSCEPQRLFLLGLLTALGRVNPDSMREDPSFDRLVSVVPFGLPDSVPEHRPLLPPRRQGEQRLLFGGLYDWYDPQPLLEVLEKGDPGWRLLVIRTPNRETPQQRFEEVRRWAQRRGLWGDRVQALDWVPYERRYDLLRDVDVLVSTHRHSLETDLSMRTRFLDAMLVGCPIVVSSGGALSDLLERSDAAWVVDPDDRAGLDAAVRRALGAQSDGEHPARLVRGRELARSFAWRHSLRPLLDFCAAPWRDEHKERFVDVPRTVAPHDGVAFRVRRRLRALFGGSPA
ncbi:MAG: glycosyltransferase [Acidobacteria bacterium]|nr:MAG: glycosyltransferase [Acidobacteriota bacterium]REK05642.1 MAG: glycosyltransferase [Acidobacteriota bacterium]